MPEVSLRRPPPPPDRKQVGEPEPDYGLVFDDSSRRVVGVYGGNEGRDWCRFYIEVGGERFGLDLPPGTRPTKIAIPARLRPRETQVEKVDPRTGVRTVKTVIPIDRLVDERVYADPSRNSPVVLSVTRTVVNGSSSPSVDMPATVDADDGLAMLFGNMDGETSSITDWTQVGRTADSSFQVANVWGKNAVGDEDGSSVTVSLSGSTDLIAHVYRIEAGSWYGDVSDGMDYAGSNVGETTTPNPPNLSPGWGTLDILWFAGTTASDDDPVNSAPPNYSNLTADTGAGISLGTARRTLEASSENPGAFGTNESFWTTFTVAIRPSEAVAQTLTGTRFQVSPTFGDATVDAEYDLTGNVFQIAPVFGTGTVATGPATLTGSLFQVSPSFGEHTVTPGAVSVTGSVFTVSPSFGAHEVDAEYDLVGTVFQVSPSFGEHTVEAGAVSLTGSVFEASPSFGDHSVGIGGLPEGNVFQIAPSFGTHTVTAGSVNVNGSLFQVSPLFGTGVVFEPIIHPPGPAKAATSTAGGRAVTTSSAGNAATNTGAGSAPTSPSSGSAPVKEN